MLDSVQKPVLGIAYACPGEPGEGIGPDEFKGHPEHRRKDERRKSRMPDFKGKHKGEEPDIQAEVETEEEDQKNTDNKRDRAIMGNGMVYPVQGSKEIQDAGKSP